MLTRGTKSGLAGTAVLAALVALACFAAAEPAASVATDVPGAGPMDATVAPPDLPQPEVPAAPDMPVMPVMAFPDPVVPQAQPVDLASTVPLRNWGGAAAVPKLAPALAARGDATLDAAGEALASPEAKAAAGAGVLATVALAFGARPFLLALAPLYSRLDKGELLDHPARRDLMGAIREEPGINMSDLQTRFDMGWGALLYHLQRLEAQGLVMSHRWGRSRRFFLNERGLMARAEGIRALKAPNARQLAEVIAANPGQTQEELASNLGLSRSVVSKYATRLEQASLVQRQVGRNCLRLFPTDELRGLLHTVRSNAPQPAAGLPQPLEPVSA